MLEILKKPLSRIVGTTIAVAGVTLLTCTMGNGIAKAEGSYVSGCSITGVRSGSWPR